MNPEQAIEENPRICGGEPVFRGTRVPVRSVLAGLAEGDSAEQIQQSFPTLTAEHIAAALVLARG